MANSPEMRLWRAVLFQALEDFKGRAQALDPTENRAMLQARARRWFFSDENGVGSFLFVCDVLDLDPKEIRGKLTRESLGQDVRRISDVG